MSNPVLAFKLVSGEEVVAEVVRPSSYSLNAPSEDAPLHNMAGDYIVRKPHVLRFQQVGPGQVGLAFVPWVLSNPDVDSVAVYGRSLVAHPVEVSTEVEKQYLQQTSGIALATSGGKIV